MQKNLEFCIKYERNDKKKEKEKGCHYSGSCDWKS